MKIRKTTTCHTCRARKLACDGKRPSCSQCLFSAKKCAGYEHDLIFRPPVVSSSYLARTSKAKRQRRRVSVESQKQQQQPVVSKQVRLPSKEFPLTRSLSWPLLDIISLVVQNFSPVGERPRFVPSQASIFSHRICGGWVEVLPELARESKADQCLSPAIKTLAVSILARGSRGTAPMSDALAAHTLALESLNNGIDDWTKSAPNIVAASIMCLFLSEIIMPTGPTSAIVHAKGIQDLMKLQQPQFYSSGLSHHLFVGFRPVLVIQAFAARRKHFLSDPAWTSIPFDFYTPSPLQSLFTDVFPLTAILGRIDDLPNAPTDEAVAGAQDIVEELLKILQSLAHRDETLKEETTAHRWLPIFPIQQDWPVQFPDIIAGNLFTHLWAFQMICAHSILTLTSRFPYLLVSTEMNGLDDLLDVKMITQLALWTFRSIEFLLQEEFKLFGAASIILPLKTACDVFKAFGTDDPEMVFWFCRVSRFIKEKGYYFLTQIFDHHE